MTLNVAIPKKSEPCWKKKEKKNLEIFHSKYLGKSTKKKKDTCQFLVKKRKNPREMGRNKHHKFFNLYVD